MSESQQPQTSPDASDPLASLHRMSTTAGLGSQEYVAINLVAVTALVLGLASALVLLSALLLLIPAISIIVGLIALRQISNSNGTQAGKGIAWLGMVVAIGIAGYVGVKEIQIRYAEKAAEQAINACVADFAKALQSEDYPKAWDTFSDRFHSRKDMTNDLFATRMKTLAANPQLGKIQSIATNGRIQIEQAPGAAMDAQKMAGSLLVIKMEKSPQPFRQPVSFRKQDANWKIEDIQSMFPQPQEGRPERPGVPNMPSR